MALDSVAVYALAAELSAAAAGGRIEKIHQPERDELVLAIRTQSDSFRLIISASPSNARVHFSSEVKENPKTAPMFCMLLRKHLQSGKITAISQPDFERILKITVSSRNELGDLVDRHLIAELTGRNSNIILTDESMRIIDSARHVDFTQSSVRQIMPGLTYQAPPPQDKIPILDAAREIKVDFSDSPKAVSNAIMAAITGISPVTAREIVWSVTGRADTLCAELSDREGIISALNGYRRRVLASDFSPVLLSEHATGRLIDFSATAVGQYGSAADCTPYPSMSGVIDAFYRVRDNKERMRQKSADLLKLINTNLERLSKKLVIQQNTLRDAESKDEYRKKGDLITAGAYLIEQGAAEAVLPDYFTEGTPSITIALSPQLSPIQNAQKYYKKYSKAKNAEIEVTKQLESTQADIEYLESTLALAENCLDVSDINAIRDELASLGYLKRRAGAKKQKKEQSKPHHFISSDGFDIYVGKNNLQNDILTLKLANSSDIWFHTKKIHGSHTVIKLGVDKDVPKTTMLEAAQLAAYFSKARASNQVPVDYTTVKNVKKPNGAKPGMVIYDGYNTIYTTPKSPEELKLKKDG